MKSLRQNRLLAGVCFLALGLTGCVTSNYRSADIGMVTAHAHLKDGKATYYQLDLHRPTDAAAPRILLQLPNGKTLDRSLFTYAALKQAGFMGTDSQDFDPSKPYSHELSRYGVSFFFNHGSLVLIRMTQTTGPSVAIAGERKKIFRTLPFAEEDLEKLFGKPDKVTDTFRL
jgi:hypothetical protein